MLVVGGGSCIACIDAIEAEGVYDIRGVVSATLPAENLMGYPAIGTNNNLPQLLISSNLTLVTVGQIKNPKIRICLFDLLKHLGARLPVIVSPKGNFSKHSLLSEGSIVMHRAVVNASVKIGKNCIVNSQALLEHGVVVQDHCHICWCSVEWKCYHWKRVFVGSGTVIKGGKCGRKCGDWCWTGCFAGCGEWCGDQPCKVSEKFGSLLKLVSIIMGILSLLNN